MLPNQGLNDSYTFAEKAASAKDLPWAPCAAPNNMFKYVQHYRISTDISRDFNDVRVHIGPCYNI
jgi:hypothetical protein